MNYKHKKLTMLNEKELDLPKVKKELNRISAEIIVLINKYRLDAVSPLEVTQIARQKITDKTDYIRFLELSLEGRIYGDYGDAFRKIEEKTIKNEV